MFTSIIALILFSGEILHRVEVMPVLYQKDSISQTHIRGIRQIETNGDDLFELVATINRKNYTGYFRSKIPYLLSIHHGL